MSGNWPPASMEFGNGNMANATMAAAATMLLMVTKAAAAFCTLTA